MNWRVSIISEADIDIDEAYTWYETRQIGLGDRFFDLVNESVLFISKNPFGYEEIYKGVRRCVMKKFPFGIYYKTLADTSEIQILGVVHFKRNPRIIKKRL